MLMKPIERQLRQRADDDNAHDIVCLQSVQDIFPFLGLVTMLGIGWHETERELKSAWLAAFSCQCANQVREEDTFKQMVLLPYQLMLDGGAVDAWVEAKDTKGAAPLAYRRAFLATHW